VCKQAADQQSAFLADSYVCASAWPVIILNLIHTFSSLSLCLDACGYVYVSLANFKLD